MNHKHATREKHEIEAIELNIVVMHNINPSQSFALASRAPKSLSLTPPNCWKQPATKAPK